VIGNLSRHEESSIRRSAEEFASTFHSNNREFASFTMSVNSEKYLHGLKEDCLARGINSYTLSTINQVIEINSINKRNKAKG
jgi:hypothetical protein